MIPREFLHKYMFLFIVSFLRCKPMLWIFIFYIAVAFYYEINDGAVLVNIFMIFFLLLALRIPIKNSLKKELYRYKKYLVFKRKRANNKRLKNSFVKNNY